MVHKWADGIFHENSWSKSVREITVVDVQKDGETDVAFVMTERNTSRAFDVENIDIWRRTIKKKHV